MAERQPTLVTPFWVRIATETSLSPGWLLIAFPAVLYPTYLALEALFGRGLAAATDFTGDSSYEAWMPPYTAFLLGYIAMMAIYVARGTFRDLEALRPVLRGGESVYFELRRQLTRFQRHRLWIGSLVGVAFAFVAGELAVGRWTRLLAGECSLHDAWVGMLLIAFWIGAGWGVAYLIESARLYSRIGEQHVAIDLLDVAPLVPLTRHGLRNVLLYMLMMASYALKVAATTGFLSTPGVMTTTFLTFFSVAVISAAAFLLPVRGLRRQIRARKAEALTRVRAQIHRDTELIAEAGPDSADAGARMPGLLAYKHEIESVREWPFDAPTLTRFFLYVAIPLGSWVGGALVERLLGAALD